VITGIDTAEGLLFPIVSGTAAPNAAVRVMAGSTSVTARATDAGTWATGPLQVSAGTFAVTASSRDGAAPSTSGTVMAPRVSLSARSGQLVVALHGIPRSTYTVAVDGTSMGTTRTDSSGNASVTLRDVPAGTHTVEAQAAADGRVGPMVAMVVAQPG
jgi:hypothetical protein